MTSFCGRTGTFEGGQQPSTIHLTADRFRWNIELGRVPSFARTVQNPKTFAEVEGFVLYAPEVSSHQVMATPLSS
jgi:hypothetical protein